MKITPAQAFNAFSVLVPGLRAIKLIDQDKIALMYHGSEQMFPMASWFSAIDWPEDVYEWPILVKPEAVKMPIVEKEQACEDCKFWKRISMDDERTRSGMIDPSKDIGRCMHHPIVIGGHYGAWAMFPIVNHDDRCGMFEQNPKLA